MTEIKRKIDAFQIKKVDEAAYFDTEQNCQYVIEMMFFVPYTGKFKFIHKGDTLLFQKFNHVSNNYDTIEEKRGVSHFSERAAIEHLISHLEQFAF